MTSFWLRTLLKNIPQITRNKSKNNQMILCCLKSCYITKISTEWEDDIYRMAENTFKLYIKQRVNIQNIWGIQTTNSQSDFIEFVD